MFKNRIRTAALAGAIAVATGVSGMAVPAFAVEANNGDHFNVDTGAATQAGENLTENQLKGNIDAITAFLDDEQGARDIVRADYLDMFASKNPEDVLDPSEQAAKDAFEQRYEEVTEQLRVASKNVADARASVRFALDADEAALAAYQALDNHMATLTIVEIAQINALIDTVNTENRTNLAPLTNLSYPSNAQEALNLEFEVQTHRLNAGNHTESDNTEDNYVARDYINALDVLEANPLVTEISGLIVTAREAAEESQRSDVLVRQLLLEHANAQVNALRAVQADYSVVARFVDLYENDAAFEDANEGWESLRARYQALLPITGGAVTDNLTKLGTAQDAVEDGFTAWENDLQNLDEYEAYLEERRSFAQNIYQNLLDNASWSTQVDLVKNLDQRFSNESAAAAEEQAREEAEEAAEAAREAEEQRQREAERLADILEQLKELQEDNDNGGNEPVSGNEGSSENAGLIGIIAAIGGVIALIAAAFPFIQNFIR